MSKNKNPGYIPNDHWVVCQRSGRVIRASEAIREWNGLIVARDEYETRHPQDFVRAKEDSQKALGLVNTEPADSYVSTSYIWETSAVAGVAVAGTAVAGANPTDPREPIPSGTFDNTL